MKTFKFEEVEYNIIGESKGESDRGFWEDLYTDVFRERTLFAYRPWWIGKKFRWLKKLTVKDQIRICRRTYFDDGWTYQNHWLPWGGEWEAVEILS